MNDENFRLDTDQSEQASEEALQTVGTFDFNVQHFGRTRERIELPDVWVQRVLLPITEEQALADLNVMCGVQTLDYSDEMSAMQGLDDLDLYHRAWALESYYYGGDDDLRGTGWISFPKERANVGEMALRAIWYDLPRNELSKFNPVTYETLRRDAVGHLNRYAQRHLMTDFHVHPEGRADNPLREEYVLDERTAPFVMQRRRSYIARMTRRGMGNVLIGCDEGLAALNLDLTKLHNMKGIVRFKTGEVVRVPFVLIGYNGNNCADSALIMVHDEKGRAAFVPHKISRYWTKLV